MIKEKEMGGKKKKKTCVDGRGQIWFKEMYRKLRKCDRQAFRQGEKLVKRTWKTPVGEHLLKKADLGEGWSRGGRVQ